MDAKRIPRPAFVYRDWTPELSAEIEKWVRQLRAYGFRTDHEEVFHQLALVVQVLRHRVDPKEIDDLLAVTIEADIRYSFPYPQRKLELRRLTKLYAAYIEKKKQEAEAVRERIRKARARRTRKGDKAGSRKHVGRSR
jgi:hypothetical protein